jgi:hypothetical protein
VLPTLFSRNMSESSFLKEKKKEFSIEISFVFKYSR